MMNFKVYDTVDKKCLDESRFLIDGTGKIYNRVPTGDVIDAYAGRYKIIENKPASADNADTREAIRQACDELKQTLLDKNSDYGDAFGETYRKLGPITGLTRFLDKSSRITHLTQKMLSGGSNEVKNETLEDTWKDAAGYAILNLINLKKWRKSDE